MFGLRFLIINNWYIGVLALCSQAGDIDAQELAARYFLTQFWAEYTIDVLYEFNSEDMTVQRDEKIAKEEAEK